MSAIKWKNIDKPNLRGKTAAIANHMAEVVQVSSDPPLWHCFRYIDGKHAPRTPGEPYDTDFVTAMKQGIDFLRPLQQQRTLLVAKATRLALAEISKLAHFYADTVAGAVNVVCVENQIQLSDEEHLEAMAKVKAALPLLNKG